MIWSFLERVSPGFKLWADLFCPLCWDLPTSAFQTLLGTTLGNCKDPGRIEILVFLQAYTQAFLLLVSQRKRMTCTFSLGCDMRSSRGPAVLSLLQLTAGLQSPQTPRARYARVVFRASLMMAVAL